MGNGKTLENIFIKNEISFSCTNKNDIIPLMFVL